MRVVLLLELGADVRIPPVCDPRSGRVREDWSVRESDPASNWALELALRLKAARSGASVTVIHMGPPSTESWLRHALALGADRVVRVWDPESTGARAAGKAVVLSAAATTAGFDLILAGAAGVLEACGQLGVLLAARLGVPCVTDATGVAVPSRVGGEPASQTAIAPDGVEITRCLERGYQERVEATLPVVVTVAGAAVPPDAAPPALSARELLHARTAEILQWDLADLGVPLDWVRRADATLRYGPSGPRRPRLRPLPAPDSSLPAFDRILRLIEGSVKRREGRVVRAPAEAVVGEVFLTLRDEGWLDHLLPNSGPAPGEDGPAQGDGGSP